ncbi:MAG: clostripain-related cysteine peptidase [Candidatus Thermoplasmatota archaeon]|nr:clostripain-related cysteine peptidase [Candidatus Thermoplasmatota archaeon]
MKTVFISLCIFLALVSVSIPAEAQTPAEWLIMVYMDGDRPVSDTCYFSLEEPGITDINEMEMGISESVTVVVQFDRGLCDTSNDGWDTTRRYLIAPDRTEETGDYKKIDSKLIEDIGEANMGDPETLIDFAMWASSSFPARRKALILWNHGSGWIDSYPQENPTPIKSICVDNYDELTMEELDYAMSTITSQYPIDLLGFDACLMQMIEVAYELKDYAPVIVGSEEIEQSTGWSYDIVLQEAGYAYAPEDLARIIVESYVGTSTSTLSAIRTSELPYVVESLNRFCDGIMSENMDVSLNSTYYFQHFDEEGNSDYADLYSFAEAMQGMELMEAIESCVIAENHGSRANAHGISIWMPTMESGYLNGYGDLKFSYDSLWDEFIAYHLGM